MARRVRRAVSSHVTVDGVTVKECATPLILFGNDRSSRTGSDRATTKTTGARLARGPHNHRRVMTHTSVPRSKKDISYRKYLNSHNPTLDDARDRRRRDGCDVRRARFVDRRCSRRSTNGGARRAKSGETQRQRSRDFGRRRGGHVDRCDRILVPRERAHGAVRGIARRVVRALDQRLI